MLTPPTTEPTRQVLVAPGGERNPQVLAAAARYNAVVITNRFVRQGTFLLVDLEGNLPRDAHLG